MSQITFNTDSPIAPATAGEDLLERRNFCSRIAGIVTLPVKSPCLVLSLEGPWGFGKTSTINMIAEELKAKDPDSRPIQVPFNPWMIGTQSALVGEFLLQMASSVGLSSQSESAKRLSQSLLSYARPFSLAKLIPGVAPYAEVIKDVIEAGSEAAKAAADLYEMNMAEQKKRVSDAILKLGKPIVVFIDDLDRLPPEEVFTMIRLIKAVSDFPQVAYVLAFDPAYIESALEKSGIFHGRTYLDKIVQVRVSLPRISLAQIKKIVDREIGAILSGESLGLFPEEGERLAYLYNQAIRPLLRTPRDVYRIFNRLRFLYPVVKDEIRFSDLFALETIAITAPAIYDHIREHPQAYVGPVEGGLKFKKAKEMVQEAESFRQAILASFREELRGPLGELVGELFPLTNKGGFNEKSPDRTTGSIASPFNLVIALTGELPSSDVSLSKARLFLKEPAARMNVARSMAAADKLEEFLRLVDSALRLESPSDSEDLVETLSKIAEFDVIELMNLRSRGSFLTPSASRQIFWILKKILERMEKERSLSLVSSLCGSSEKIAISTGLLEFLCYQQGVLDGKPRDSEESWMVTSTELQVLIQEWVKVNREAFLGGDAFSSKEAGPAFLLLKHLDNRAAREVVSRSLESIERTDDLARVIGSGSWDSVKGAYANVGGEFLVDIGVPDQIRSAAEARLSSSDSLTADLKAIYTSMITGTKQYFVDFGSQ